jgi:DNA primase
MPRSRRESATSGGVRDDRDRDRKLDALRARVQDEAGTIRTADDWARSLRAAALLRETFANSLLIRAQRPDATLVKGYEDWRKAGRQVIRREPGIQIFSRAAVTPQPRRRGTRRDLPLEEERWSWRDATRAAYVWDISQTTGQALAAPALVPAPPDELWDALCWIARRLGYAVEREQGAPADGVTWWTLRRIRVASGPGTAGAGRALAHQLGHVLLHRPGTGPSGATTSGDFCRGVIKAEADAVAYIIGARHGAAAAGWPGWPQTWAGTDPRASPGAAILTAGERITTAAAQLTQHLDQTLHQQPSPASAVAVPRARPPVSQPQAPEVPDHPATAASPGVLKALEDAGQYYIAQIPGSWVPEYLASRGIGPAVAVGWRIGYAPAGWTALTGHLRDLGHTDHDIEAAGLARRSSSGTLIDHFRDRVMLPVGDEHGALAGFTGRAHPGATDVPKYFNSPNSAAYRKKELLFGWDQARTLMSAGAIPVIVEGPVDAIAVTLAEPGRYAGLAPCGTALTSQQAALLSRAISPGSPVIVAFDDDTAGRKAAVRAHDILRPVSDQLQSAVLSGRDPAQILQDDGAPALAAVLAELQPLSAAVIDAAISPWEHRLEEADGPLLAMRSAAAVIARLLPAGTATAIRRITKGRELATTDGDMRPVVPPELPEIARLLPAETAYQIARVAGRLGIADYSEVVAEVANASSRPPPPAHTRGARAPRLAAASFPQPPHVVPGEAAPARNRPSDPGCRKRRDSPHPAR